MCVLARFHTLVLVQDWDKPEYIPDPEAKMPEDWDDDMDGEWEPPMIPNPDYKVLPDNGHLSSVKYTLTYIQRVY